MSRVKVKGKHHYILHDRFDRDKKNPVNISFEKPLVKGDTFTLNDVTYKVIKSPSKYNVVIIKMIKYKIENTATSIVHKCPARATMSRELTENKIVEMKKKYGDKIVDNFLSGRVKMHSIKQAKCPFCNVKFWKEKIEIPEQVHINSRIKGRKQLINRSAT